jgi:esterase/lipase
MDQRADGHDYAIDAATYAWAARVFSTVERMLKVRIRLHGDHELMERGQIFLFNHFARFETFIPQYLIHRHTGAYCRSIASQEFFADDDVLAGFLRNVGALPNNLPGLLPLLARELLHGRKLVVFPEGGMVKDRRVLDETGAYRVYSPTARERRSHHTGAAVLAQVLETLKGGLLQAEQRGDDATLAHWAEELGFAAPEALLDAARQPTLIVPTTITFYPIRVKDNLLRRGTELFRRKLSRRITEELLVEGNILLRDTDMDLRLGTPLTPTAWRWGERPVVHRLLRHHRKLDDYFAPTPPTWDLRLLAAGLRRRILQLRNDYMRGLYTGVTVNLSHLAARLILTLVERGEIEIARDRFQRLLYLAVKQAQSRDHVYMHRSLQDPDGYLTVLDGACTGLQQFEEMAAEMQLVEVTDSGYRFLPKLREEHAFDTIRLENLVTVYANEVAPIRSVHEAIDAALQLEPEWHGIARAETLFDDELRGHAYDRRAYRKVRHAAINDAETATADGAPFLLNPRAAPFGVLLVHGFLASPAELRGLGERLAGTGLPVHGIRLKGHATSPWDLRERAWEEWLAAVRRGYRIVAALCPQVAVVGFSTGGALALLLAAERPAGLAGVVSAGVPLVFRHPGMAFVPLMHQANRFTRWVTSNDGVMPFRRHVSEHPAINYQNMPIRGLNELHRMVDALRARLGQVACPVLQLQATDDPVVDPAGAEIVHDLLGTPERRLCWIASERHGIVHEEIGGSHDAIVDFLDEVGVRATAPLRPPAGPGADGPPDVAPVLAPG